MKKLFISLLYFFIAVFASMSQDGISVKSFIDLPNDLDARVNYPKIDQNGQKCALVKVVTTESDFTFDNGQLGVVAAIHKPELSEWWVYLPEKTMKLKIMHPVYGQLKESEDGFYYFPNSLKGATCYRMEITSQQRIVRYRPKRIETGFLVINSEPESCQVYLTENNEEQYAGVTPFQKKLPYGTYNYRVKKALYHDEVGIAVIDTSYVEQNVKLRSSSGSLKVTTQPSGAKVIFEKSGSEFTSPCEIHNLPSGKHVVNVVAPDYALQRHTVEIKDGDTTHLDLVLEATFAQVTINTLPGAKISINGVEKGIGQFVGNLNEGVYDVEVLLDGYRKATRQIVVKSKQDQTLNVRLRPICGSLDVITTPMRANVLINGKNYGLTPITIDSLLIGEYDVILSKEGYASQSHHVKIEKDVTSAIEATLSQGKEVTITSDIAGDEVYIDGVKQGVSPLKVGLNLGSHSIEIRRGEKKTTQTVLVTNATNLVVLTINSSTVAPVGNDVPKANVVNLTPKWSRHINPAQKEALQKLIESMVAVDGGVFMMGATKEQDGDGASSDEKPVHQVRLNDYLISNIEVTQELWAYVMGKNPSFYSGANLPVESVSWKDCQEFIKKVNHLTGLKFRLPSEAEWEYAARGGNKSMGYKFSGSNSLAKVAWYANNAASTTHDIATKEPNELGIYDMSGNVYEWCNDWYGTYSSSSQINPLGPVEGENRVIRGGRWNSSMKNCRVSYRFYADSEYFDRTIGLRLAHNPQ